MHVIEEKIIMTAKRGQSAKLSMRDSVDTNGNRVCFWLWSSCIAKLENGFLKICFHGYNTQTTKSRINALISAFASGYIRQKNYTLYYVNNGKETEIDTSKTYLIKNGTITESCFFC